MATTDSTRSSVLSSRAMLISVRISQWSGRRLDRNVTDTVNKQHGAHADAGRYNKQLLDKEATAEIVKIVGEARSGFVERTLPWVDDGQRIMANHGYTDFTRWFRDVSDRFHGAVSAFLGAYPGHVEAAKVRLNGMFRPEDYPSVDELRGKFGITTSIMPVPAADDFRVAMSEAQADMIRRDIERSVNEASNTAVRDVYRRVHDVCAAMVERMAAYDAKKDGERTGFFRDTLVTNIRDLSSSMAGLNITGDPAIEQLAKRLASLGAVEPQSLRDNGGKRADASHQAQQILDDISGLLG